MHGPHSRHSVGGYLSHHQEVSWFVMFYCTKKRPPPPYIIILTNPKLLFLQNLAVMVVMVIQGSPAEKAGIQSGDIILKFNSRPCHTAGNLLNLVGAHTGNGEVEVLVKRRGVKKPVHLKLVPEAEK